MEEFEVLKRAYERERLARKKAETILEKKSYELFLANQALTHNNFSLSEKVEEQTAKLQQIVDIITILLPQITLDQIAQSLIKISKSKFNFPFCTIFFWDEIQERYVSRSTESVQFSQEIEVGNNLFSEVIQSAKGVIKDKLHGDTLSCKKENQSIGSELIVPVLDQEFVIGIIHCTHPRVDSITVDHLEIFTTIANLVSSKIKNAITLEKQAIIEQQLRESEKRFRIIVENAADAIYEISPDGFFSYVNPIFIQKTGYSLEELMSKKFWSLVQKSQRKEVIEFYLLQLMNQVQETNYEFGAITKSGELIWISQNVQARFSNQGQFLGAIVVARDITEKVRYTKKLRLQEEKYRRIISNMDLGLLEVSHDDNILRANESFCKHSGYSEKELIGKKAIDLFLIEQDSKDLLEEKNGLRSKGVSDQYQVKIVNKEGENRWWLISGAPNYDVDGNQIGSIGIHLDITEQKELENELEEARRKAEEFAEAKETFLANMSHEIRTPLNAIIGMLRELGKGSLSQKQTNQLYNAQTASQHLLSIISNVLDMSKIDAGELHLDKKPFNLAIILQQTLSMFHNHAEEKSVDLQLHISPWVHKTHIGDPARIRQILINIVGNSIKFTRNGSITIRCTCEEQANGEQEINLSIQDEGIGMSQEYLDNLFKQFSQERNETTQQTGGTGLGMAITKELVVLMNGRIHARSQKGIGTTIDVYIPLQKGENLDYVHTEKELAYESLKNKKILLVEDNEMNRAVARATLDHWGLITTEVTNGLLAVEMLQSISFDVILMDLQMPIMGGIEATRIIRQEHNIQTPIIALSANAFKKEIDLCLQEGMDGYVTKPFEEEELLNTILRFGGEKHESDLFPDRLSEEKPKVRQNVETLFDLSHLIKASRGNDEFVQNMIEIFQEFVLEAIPELHRSLREEDFETMYVMAHRLKPMIDHIGISLLKQEIRMIEKIAYQGTQTDSLPELISHTCRILQEVSKQLSISA